MIKILRTSDNKVLCRAKYESKYGLLYNWPAATYSTGGASIAPSGWHVPTRTEWETLVYTLGGSISGLYIVTPNTMGNDLKESGTTHWNSPNTGATNSTGFNGRGGGYRLQTTGAFNGLKDIGQYWSTTLNGTSPYYVSLTQYPASLISAYGAKNYGIQIRLIKDDSTDPGSVTDFDGNVYRTVKIGSQVWMADNLMVEHYNDGTIIPKVTDNSTWASLSTGACCAYNNDVANVKTQSGIKSILRANVFTEAEHVFLVDSNRDVYDFNIPEKTISLLFNSVGYGDIANNSDKIIIGNSGGNGSTEYNFTHNPFSYSENRTWNYGLGNTYCYVDENTLIFGSYGSLSKLNLSNNPPTIINTWTIPYSRQLSGDIIYNPTSQTYIISTYLSGHYYLMELDSSLGFIKEIEHSYSSVMGLFVYNNKLYACNYNGSGTDIYEVVNGVFTLYASISVKTITGASQNYIQNNVRL